MDFDIKKPSHIISFLLLVASLFLIIGLSVISLFLDTDVPEVDEDLKLFVSVFTLIVQLFIFIMFMIIVPIIWYIFVNGLKIKDVFKRLRLDFKSFDKAILWGLLAFFLIMGLNVLLSLALQVLGYSTNDTSNVQDIEKIFEKLPIAMFIIVAFQPIGEEIFFRGFLLDKLDGFFNYKKENTGFFSEYKIAAVLITSLLFGIAHLSYAKVYVFIFTTIIGFILGIIVVKTKNLYSAIIAHMLMNISTLVIYFMYKDILGF